MESRLRPGDRLPSERELALEYGVSRTVVREAVRALVAKNLLEVQPGSGTVVRRPTVAPVARSMALLLRVGQDQIDYGKLHEVRRTLEVELVALAAERRTEEDLAGIERLLAEAPSTWDDQDRFAEHDLAAAAHNEIAAYLPTGGVLELALPAQVYEAHWFDPRTVISSPPPPMAPSSPPPAAPTKMATRGIGRCCFSTSTAKRLSEASRFCAANGSRTNPPHPRFTATWLRTARTARED